MAVTSWRANVAGPRCLVLRMNEHTIGRLIPHSLLGLGVPVVWTGAFSQQDLANHAYVVGFSVSSQQLLQLDGWMERLDEQQRGRIETTCRLLRIAMDMYITLRPPSIVACGTRFPSLATLHIDVGCIPEQEMTAVMTAIVDHLPKLTRLWLQQSHGDMDYFSTTALRQLGEATQLECLVLDVRLDLWRTGTMRCWNSDFEASEDEEVFGIPDESESGSDDALEEKRRQVDERRQAENARQDSLDFWHVFCSLPILASPSTHLTDLSLGHGVCCCSPRGNVAQLLPNTSPLRRLMLDATVRRRLQPHVCTQRFPMLIHPLAPTSAAPAVPATQHHQSPFTYVPCSRKQP